MAKFNTSPAVRPVNTETGEIMEGVFAFLPVRRKNAFCEGWFAMSNDAIRQILTLTMERALTLRDLQVLYAMLEVLELENFIRISQKHLAERLEMHQPHISRSITTLIKNGIVLQGPKIGSSSTYRLNPHFGWKGSGKSHHAALREQMKAPRLAPVVAIPTKPAEPERDPLTVDMFNGKADADEARQ